MPSTKEFSVFNKSSYMGGITYRALSLMGCSAKNKISDGALDNQNHTYTKEYESPEVTRKKLELPPIRPPPKSTFKGPNAFALGKERHAVEKRRRLAPLGWWPSSLAAKKREAGVEPSAGVADGGGSEEGDDMETKNTVIDCRTLEISGKLIKVKIRVKTVERDNAMHGQLYISRGDKVREQEQYIENEQKLVRQVVAGDGIHPLDAHAVVRACCPSGVRFVDAAFPPTSSSLRLITRDPVIWMRPAHFLEQPEKAAMNVGAIAPTDVKQGQLGDCWFMSSLAAMAQFPELVTASFFGEPSNSICSSGIDKGRSRANLRSVGVWRVNLCIGGWWEEIILDDYLPCSDKDMSPQFGRSVDEPAEMWVAVMEKAYAKVHASYAAVCGGDETDALQDLTGFPCERFSFGFGDSIFAKITEWARLGHLMTATVNPKTVESDPRGMDAGLVRSHGYTLLRAVEADGIRLLQFRNPWGNDKKWNGDWGDDSTLWEQHPEVRAACRFSKAADGTFWMSWADADRWWDTGGVCLVNSSWREVRFKNVFDTDDVPTMFLEVTVKTACRMYFGVHQRSARGLPGTHPDTEYCAVRIKVMEPPLDTASPDAAYSLLASSSCCLSQHVHLEHHFKPAVRPYYIFFRNYVPSNRRRTLTVSLHHEVPAFGRVRVLRCSKSLIDALQYKSPCPYGTFEPEKAEPVAVEMQQGRSREELVHSTLGDTYPS